MFYMSRAYDRQATESPLILNPIRGSFLPQPPKQVVISKKELGQRLRAARQARGITQVELAEALGTYQTVVSAIERGVRGLTVQQVAKLASILGTSLDDILAPGRRPGNGSLTDRRFLRRFEKIERLSKRDKQALLKNIDMFLKGAGVS